MKKNNLKKYGKPEKRGRETRLRMRAPKGSTLPTFCTITIVRKKRGNALPVVNFRLKGLTRADIAQLPVAHAHSVLLSRTSSGHATSGHVTDLTSGHVTSCGSTTYANWAVPTYYFSIYSVFPFETSNCTNYIHFDNKNVCTSADQIKYSRLINVWSLETCIHTQDDRRYKRKNF